MSHTYSTFLHLECSECGEVYPKDDLLNLCPACRRPLLARYDLERARRLLPRGDLTDCGPNMWRYHEILPVESEANVLSLGEGWTPLWQAKRLGRLLGFSRLYVKDESPNPTGSFKARGMSAALSKAMERGVARVALPTAGNAGGAAAAYSAKAGIEAFVFMPMDTPAAFPTECEQYGAVVEKVDGLIDDCGRIVAERQSREGWFDLSTLKEPYRVEGKKTMGYELAEQFAWELPDAIIFPTGGGTGIIGLWKAFAEMEQLGWIDARRPRLIAVQAQGCAPLVRAFAQECEKADPFANAYTVASGLRVPSPMGDFLTLKALRESGGTAVAVSDDAMLEGVKHLGKTEGVFSAPEGGATVAALPLLKEMGQIDAEERIVLFITGSGLKYLEAFAAPDTR